MLFSMRAAVSANGSLRARIFCRRSRPNLAWWRYMLLDDPEAKAMFVGPDCGLCNMGEEFDFGHNALLQ